MISQKLVMFDIDGTIIKALRPVDALQRMRVALKNVFNVDVGPITDTLWKERNYNGKGDRFILWDIVSRVGGVTRDAFLDRLGEIGKEFCVYLDTLAPQGPLYEAISDAKILVGKVITADHLSEGVLTGNLGASASWKLRSVGLPEFAFGVYGHEADERDDLARLIIPKAQAFFGKSVAPGDIIIIGDTVNDVTCARAIGATVVIVSTGWNVKKEEFTDAPPDIHVDSLMDGEVLQLLGLE